MMELMDGITMVVFVIFSHVAASYQCVEWPITHHWRSVCVCCVCIHACVCICKWRDKKDNAEAPAPLRSACRQAFVKK